MEKIIKTKVTATGSKTHGGGKITEYIVVEIMGDEVRLPITKAMSKQVCDATNVTITITI